MIWKVLYRVLKQQTIQNMYYVFITELFSILPDILGAEVLFLSGMSSYKWAFTKTLRVARLRM
jgi:hypothetical protein